MGLFCVHCFTVAWLLLATILGNTSFPPFSEVKRWPACYSVSAFLHPLPLPVSRANSSCPYSPIMLDQLHVLTPTGIVTAAPTRTATSVRTNTPRPTSTRTAIATTSPTRTASPTATSLPSGSTIGGTTKSVWDLAPFLLTALGSGSAVYLFFLRRQRFPRLEISHAVSHFAIDVNHYLVHVDLQITNKGDVLAKLPDGVIWIQGVVPYPSRLIELLQEGKSVFLSKTYQVGWPVMGDAKHDLDWNREPIEIEPTCSEIIPIDLVIPGPAEWILVYTYLRNISKRRHWRLRKLNSERWIFGVRTTDEKGNRCYCWPIRIEFDGEISNWPLRSRDIGWSRKTLYNLKDEDKQSSSLVIARR